MLAYLILALAQLAVGAAAIFARFALGGAEPLAVAAARLCIASAMLLLWFRGARVDRRANVVLCASGIALAVHFATWIWSLQYTSVAVSTLLVASTPIWTSIYDALVHRKPLSRVATLALLCGGAGLVLVVGFDRAPAPQPGHELLGAMLALVGSVAIGAYFLAVRTVRDRVDTAGIVTRTYSWAALALVIAALVAHQPPPPLHATAAWAGILAMALISQLLGHTALNASLRWFSPSAISFSSLIEPVIAAVLALIIFHEALAPIAILGGVVLLAAIAVFLREDYWPTPDH